MIVGWVLWGLAPLFHAFEENGGIFTLIYGLLILLGSFFIATAVILEFSIIPKKTITLSSIVFSLPCVILFFFVESRTYFDIVVILQFSMLQIILIVGILRIKKIKRVGGVYSVVWLSFLVILGVLQSVFFTHIPSFKTTDTAFGINYLIAFFIALFITTVEGEIAENKIQDIHAQLLHSQKMEAVGRFAGGIAHDFNNLLTVINGLSSTASDSYPNLDAAVKRDLMDIMEAGKRAEDLTKKLLAFSRKQKLHPDNVELNSLLSNLKPLIERIIGKNITLEMEYSNQKLPLYWDAGQIEQIIMNLSVNAIDSMPEGGTLSITTSHVHLSRADILKLKIPVNPGNYAKLSVIDEGMGMDKVVLSHLFEPFYTTKDPEKGTGLGLSIVYGIIKELNGSISVESQEGKGSSFQVYFPLSV